MAAVPLCDPHVLALICDACHRGMAGVTTHATAWPIMWRLATDRGWSGAAGPDGPHRCATCAPAGSRTCGGYPSARLLAHLAAVPVAAVVRLTGDLDTSVAGALDAVLNRATDNHANLVLDLQSVHLIDSTVLGVLVRTHQRLKPTGGKVCLAAPSQFVRVVLHTMHLETLFPIFEAAVAAVDRLSGSKRGP